MVCHRSVPDGLPQPDTRVLDPATPLHPAKAITAGMTPNSGADDVTRIPRGRETRVRRLEEGTEKTPSRGIDAGGSFRDGPTRVVASTCVF